MVSAKIISLSGQKKYQDVFPLVYNLSLEQTKTDDIIAWVKEKKSNLLKKSANHGAILFRGFPIYNDSDFVTGPELVPSGIFHNGRIQTILLLSR